MEENSLGSVSLYFRPKSVAEYLYNNGKQIRTVIIGNLAAKPRKTLEQ